MDNVCHHTYVAQFSMRVLLLFEVILLLSFSLGFCFQRMNFGQKPSWSTVALEAEGIQVFAKIDSTCLLWKIVVLCGVTFLSTRYEEI